MSFKWRNTNNNNNNYDPLLVSNTDGNIVSESSINLQNNYDNNDLQKIWNEIYYLKQENNQMKQEIQELKNEIYYLKNNNNEESNNEKINSFIAMDVSKGKDKWLLQKGLQFISENQIKYTENGDGRWRTIFSKNAYDEGITQLRIKINNIHISQYIALGIVHQSSIDINCVGYCVGTKNFGDSYGYNGDNGKVLFNNGYIEHFLGEKLGVNSILMILLNCNDNILQFYINGTKQGMDIPIKNGKYSFGISMYETYDQIELM